MGGKSPEPPPKITLKFGNRANTGSGISVDNDALKRQQDLVKAGSSSQGTLATSQSRSLPDKTGPGLEKAPINGVKREASQGRSPGLASAQINGVVQPTMAPPVHTTSRIASGSPHPQTLAPAVNGTVPANSYPSSAFSSFFRPAGKGNSSSIRKRNC